MSGAETLGEQNACDAGELIGLLAEQRDLYAQLAGLAEHQGSLIAGDDTERLLAVLAERQKILDCLAVLADRLRPHQQNWRAIRSGMTEADGGQADRLVSETNALLSKILEKDAEDVQLLESRKGATATAMAGLKRSKQVGAAYAAAERTSQSRVEWADE